MGQVDSGQSLQYLQITLFPVDLHALNYDDMYKLLTSILTIQ